MANENLRMSDEQMWTIIDEVSANVMISNKEVLTSDEASMYMGISKSYLYKLTMRNEIPHYKPLGKMCYFKREELEKWLLKNRHATDEELEMQAKKYCMEHKRK